MSEWQDIKTAPRDGTRILYTNRLGEIGHCWWSEAEDPEDESCWWDDDRDDQAAARWWMPALPPPPNRASPIHPETGKD